MRSFWSDPYLWIHLAGFAAVPIFLNLCLIGFAVSNPVLPTGLELLLVALAGIAPILWMQWQRPFYIFSLPGLVLKPAELTEAQRRLLTLFKAQRNQIIAVVVAIALAFGLQWLYNSAAIAAEVAPFTGQNRLVGLLLAAVGFLGVNLFTQVPISVLSVMLTSDQTLMATPTYPFEQIQSSFSLLGLRLSQILPPIQPEAKSLPSVKPEQQIATPMANDLVAGSASFNQVNHLDPPAIEVTGAVTPAIDLATETPDIWDEVEAEAADVTAAIAEPLAPDADSQAQADEVEAEVAKPASESD